MLNDESRSSDEIVRKRKTLRKMRKRREEAGTEKPLIGVRQVTNVSHLNIEVLASHPNPSVN